MKHKETILLISVALIVGLLVGILVSKGNKGSQPAQLSAPPAPAVNYQQNIQMLESLVAGDPKNRNGWVELGNNYFDSNQPMKAIEAYAKALELKADDANVLTDQGVMFRQVGWYDRAIDNFTKAVKVEPGHLQGLFNLGIVYRYDLQDFAKAKVVWERYLELNPAGPGADRVRSELEFITSHPALPDAGGQPLPSASK